MGLGGTVKRLAAKASLQRPYDEQIMTARQLFEWASANIPSVTFEYCTTEEYERQQIFLEERFQKARTIPGTRKLHSYVPISRDKVRTRHFSSSTIYKDVSISLLENELTLEEISGFITCSYDDQWWVACVLQLDSDNETVKVNATSSWAMHLSKQTKYSYLASTSHIDKGRSKNQNWPCFHINKERKQRSF